MAGDIRAKISMDTSQLASDTAKSENLIRELSHSTKEQFAEMGKSMMGAFAIGEGVAFVKESIEKLASVSDLAKQFNTTAESVQRMSHVAQEAGGDFTDMAKALNHAASVAVAAANGNKDASEAFAALGINAGDFLKLNLEERGAAIAEAIGNMTDKAKAHDYAMELLGNRGRVAYAALSDGVEKYREGLDSAFVASDQMIADMKKTKAEFEQLSTLMTVVGGIVAQVWLAIGASISETITNVLAAVGILYNVMTGHFARAMEIGSNAVKNHISVLKQWLDIASNIANLTGSKVDLNESLGLGSTKKPKEGGETTSSTDDDSSGGDTATTPELTPKQLAKQKAEKDKKDAEELKKLTEENDSKAREEYIKGQSLNVQKEIREDDIEQTINKSATDNVNDPIAAQKDIALIREQRAALAEVDKQIKETAEKKKKDSDELADKHRENTLKGKEIDIEASSESKDKKLSDESELIKGAIAEREEAEKKTVDPKKKEEIAGQKNALKERLNSINEEMASRKKETTKAKDDLKKSDLHDSIDANKTTEEKLKKTIAPNIAVDSLRRIGGTAAGVNYHAGADNGPAEKQISALEKLIAVQELQYKELEKITRGQGGSGDGSF